MATPPVRIVTDGGVELPTSVIRQYQIGIVPCQFQIGKAIYESNQETPLEVLNQQLGKAPKVQRLPLAHSAFVQAYRASPVPVLSIHGHAAFGDAIHGARLARHLLGAYRQVKVLETRTVDVGVSFLTMVAAWAAQEGDDLDQILLLLQRLQDEAMETFILTTDGSRFAADLPKTGWFDKLVPGTEYLLKIDKKQGGLQILACGRGLIQQPDKLSSVFGTLPKPSELWMRQQGYATTLAGLQSHLAGLVQAGQVRLEAGGLSGCLFGKRYAVAVVYPPREVVERVRAFVQRMWKTFGPAAFSATPAAG